MLTEKTQKIIALKEKINSYGKENLHEILHFVSEGVKGVFGTPNSRIYLEDLTEGVLICAYARGEREADIRGTSYFIDPKKSLVSRAFVEKRPYLAQSLRNSKMEIEEEFARKFGIRSSAIMPIIYEDVAIGVLCIDGSQEGRVIKPYQLRVLMDFLSAIAPSINIARKHHQHVQLAKQVDKARKREAAFLMVRSAVKLVDKLSLASVLVPEEEYAGHGRQPYLEILAAYTRDPGHMSIYEDKTKISLKKGESLLSTLVEWEPKLGAVCNERFLHPIYYPDVKRQLFQRRDMAERIGLSSLYTVPRYDKDTRKLICIVNYYTIEPYEFNPFEKSLLESHAEMVEKAIHEIGREHIEIRVLSEINELLTEKNENLPIFLNKVLSKACELIGADTGSIALVREIGGEKWLLVEDEQGRLAGAKSREWRKKHIPPIKIGGENLEISERSMTGLVAYTKRPHILKNTQEEKAKGGFYMEISPEVRSELAVPVLLEDEVIAIINLDSFTEAFFTEEHKRILEIIARLVARHISDLQRIDELQQEVERLKRDINYRDPKVSSYRLGTIIGNSPKSQEIVGLINRIVPPLYNRIAQWERGLEKEAPIGLPSILITGETGSGKEFIFNHIYSLLNEMYRRDKKGNFELPLKKTNIAAYSGELTYSELFGHKKGSFTGAYADRKGILEEANGGLVFLDEIGDADPRTQVQLLRFLDNGGFVRLGENQTRFSRVLLVAATNKDLKEMIKAGTFREDLYHRLSELTIEVPSLNERREDIPDLATHFLGKLYLTYKGKDEDEKAMPYLDDEAKEILKNHNFRGNVRELRSILLRALLSRTNRRIGKREILRAIASLPRESGPKSLKDLRDAAAEEIYEAIVSKGRDFWDVVYRPYRKSEISREVVKRVCEKAGLEEGDSLPRIASRLRVCSPDFKDHPGEMRKFISFKNFLYKTIKITQ